MRSPLFEKIEHATQAGSFAMQNDRMLKVDLAGTEGHFFARQGSMVAYQGDVDFAYEGSGSVGRMFKKVFTGEGMSLMKVTGRGDVFFADDAMEIHLVNLENDSLTVNGSNVLAFDSTLTWDIKRVEGASMMAGGVFNTTFTGTGTVADTHTVPSRRSTVAAPPASATAASAPSSPRPRSRADSVTACCRRTPVAADPRTPTPSARTTTTAGSATANSAVTAPRSSSGRPIIAP